MKDTVREVWKDFFIAIKQRLDGKGLVSDSILKQIKNKAISSAINILNKLNTESALKLDSKLLEKLKNLTYLTYCKKDENGNYLQTQEEYFINPTRKSDICFVTNQFYNSNDLFGKIRYDLAQFTPFEVLREAYNGYYNDNCFSDYSKLDEKVDFFVNIYGDIYYVDKNSLKKLAVAFDDEINETNIDFKMLDVYNEVFSKNKIVKKDEEEHKKGRIARNG